MDQSYDAIEGDIHWCYRKIYGYTNKIKKNRRALSFVKHEQPERYPCLEHILVHAYSYPRDSCQWLSKGKVVDPFHTINFIKTRWIITKEWKHKTHPFSLEESRQAWGLLTRHSFREKYRW